MKREVSIVIARGRRRKSFGPMRFDRDESELFRDLVARVYGTQFYYDVTSKKRVR
jgi:hypothetical protein